MQSNSETSKRRGGRGRVSLYFLLGAGIGAVAALLFAPRTRTKAQNLYAVEPRNDRKDEVSNLRRLEDGSKNRPLSDQRIAGLALGAETAANARKRSARNVILPDLRISEQRYRLAHSGRRPSNIL